MTKRSLTVQEFEVEALGGRIFTVEFVKRTNGELRRMNCRMGVTKGTKGGTLSYDPRAHHLLPVYDVQKEGHRMVNLEDLVSLRMDGRSYVWDNEAARLIEKDDKT